MSLFTATFLTAIFLIGFGVLLFFQKEASEKALKAFPRSKKMTYLFMAIAVSWFSLRLYNLAPSDFGEHKELLLALFLATAVASFYFIPDFLSARALAGCLLLLADALLDAAFMQTPTTRLFLVSYVYLMILIAFILGASPYLIRDWIHWIFKTPYRVNGFAFTFLSYGLLLMLVAFTY